MIGEIEVRILDKTDNTLEFEVVGETHTFCNLLVDFLNRHPDVDYAAYKIDHPLVGVPRVFFKTKGRKPEEVLEEVVNQILSVLEELEKKMCEEFKVSL